MENIKHDLSSEADIKRMVDSFYEKVNADETLSPVFNEFAQVNWEKHLPKMYSFWNKVLFAKGEYKGNPFAAHLPLPVDQVHFEKWVAIFEENMDELFSGPVAESTKLRARSIAHVFQSKLAYLNKNAS
ncbi:MAG TPA: group III truncated hemoglobin [Bacteroidetes bacterium]|nr:group III truncated hemoglobin [Bacteroidota bacterium]